MLSAALARWRLPACAIGCASAIAAALDRAVGGVAALVARGAAGAAGLGLVAVGGRLRARRAGRRGASSSWYRHATVAARILALFVAFLVPALLLYPSIDYLRRARDASLIATRYAVQAQKHAQTLQEH